MARPREVPGFDCEEPFALGRGAGGRGAGRARSSSTRDGVLDIGDVERVHDMRVATRRLRAAMEVFEPCFPRKRFRKALKEVKALADALGERRDRDVEIEFLERFAERGRPATIAMRSRPWSSACARSSDRQTRSWRRSSPTKRLEQAAPPARQAGRGGRGVKARRVKKLDPATPLRRNAARIVRTRLDELRSFAETALDPRAATAQHDMRIAAKRLRYVLEIVEACFGADAVAARRAAKELQAVLGEIHDCDVMLPRAEGIESLAGPAADPPRAALPPLPRPLAGGGEQGHLGRARTRALARIAGHRSFTRSFPAGSQVFPAIREF